MATHINLDAELTDLSVATAPGEELVQTTAHHPFWSRKRSAWVNAAELRAGEELQTPTVSVPCPSGWLVMHDPNERARMQFTGFRESVLYSVTVDDLQFPLMVQILLREGASSFLTLVPAG